MARAFQWAQATTQESLGKDCRVDLVLRTKTKVHLVEVKVAAIETQSSRWGQIGKPQVQRYLDLRLGHVTYLTTRDSLSPETDHRGRKYVMVKHALLEDLYQLLRTARVSPLGSIFLEFMKENDMSGPEPFSRQELRRADNSMRVFQKCLSTLTIVTTEVNTRFRSNVKTYSNLTRPTYSGGDDGGEVQCYLSDYSGRGAVKSIGLSITPEGGRVYFYVWMWGKLDPSIARIRSHLQWQGFDGEHGCSSRIALNGTTNDIPRMVDHAVRESRQLGRAIRRFA